MKSNGDLTEGIIFPIVENGKKVMYVTNASYEVIAKSFENSMSTEEYIEEIKERGYRINKYRSTIYINFDEK